jgi:hypothetical protein
VNPGTGELSIVVACDGTIVAALEHGTDVAYRCSNAPIPMGQFVFVGVNFGPAGFDLYVDGDRATRTGSLGFRGNNCVTPITCGGTTTAGLDGNDNPFVVGAENIAMPGAADDLDLPLRQGRIDGLRISSQNRTY